MKRLTVFSSIAAAALAIAGCQKPEIETIVPGNGEGSTFELYAEIAQTKTTLDATTYEVAWDEGDVIYMVTSDGTWGVPYAEDNTTESIATFTYSGGKFTTPATIDEGDYTFNAVYSNGKQMSYHRSDVTTNQLYATQTQDCSAPTDHIKAYDALVGTFTANIPLDEPATVNMNHIYTLMQVNVKNSTGANIEVTSFQMTAADAALAGVFYVNAFDTPAIAIKSGASESITVNVTDGTVAEDGSLPVYFVMAPLANYSGDVTFKVTDSEGNTYSKTVTMNGISFEAGEYNRTSYTISAADEVEPEPEGTASATISFASDAHRVSQDNDSQIWENDGVTFTNAKNESTNNVVSNVNPVRLYKNSKITIEAPGNIVKIEFTSATGDYFTALKSLLPNASVSGQVVTEVYDGSSNTVEYVLSTGQLRFNSITVTYSTEGYVPPVLESIAVSGEYKTEFTQGSAFSFGGVVTATYDNGATKNVTADCEFTGYDLEQLGDQTVTVTYEGKTAEYDITVVEKPAAGTSVTVEMSSFSNTADDMDDVISYTTAKGGGTSNPAINNSIIRIYQAGSGKTEGGSITITAKDGYTLTSVTIGSNMATSIAYTIGESTTKSASSELSKNGTYTVDDINANSITFYCMGTSSTARLYVNYLSATYTSN